MSKVTIDLYEELGHLLNPEGWRMLAGKLGYTIGQANNYGLLQNRVTQEILTDWSTKKDSNLYTLALYLMQMNRHDCLGKINDYLERLNRTTNV